MKNEILMEEIWGGPVNSIQGAILIDCAESESAMEIFIKNFVILIRWLIRSRIASKSIIIEINFKFGPDIFILCIKFNSFTSKVYDELMRLLLFEKQ